MRCHPSRQRTGKNDGSVVAWGNPSEGGGPIPLLAYEVVKTCSTDTAFAVLKYDGSVATWGQRNSGDDSSSVASQLTDVVALADPSTDDTFVPTRLWRISASNPDGAYTVSSKINISLQVSTRCGPCVIQ
ncbi:hypothetical protein [Ottowia sp.]|uniref:hypothetical protein n=1 Tax=Ottowia sp. TaxID=1898956 RepID=UPI002BCB317E|nr:hypothetical protein [Ottowia sp.]HRN76684.1 hypothetical protein [Ottowia sp.]HRQ03784.1 hypothetical protein [Ottowia sp.]